MHPTENTEASPALLLAQQLVALASPTPQDGGCMPVIEARLASLGFVAHWLTFGQGDQGPLAQVSNLWLKRTGASPQAKTLVFAGHTDVVPTGPLDQWTTPPFSPTVREGRLYGRGAADMKASIACFVVAVEAFLARNPHPPHSIALLLTSDEEGPAINGTVKVCEWLQANNERLDWCIVGEPTSSKACGDMIKNGRRGTLSGRLTVKGVQGHIAYSRLARNPIHMVAPALATLTRTVWDRGNDYFEPTSFQISNIHAGTGASNVIPGDCVVDFNFRFCTESTCASLQARVHSLLQAQGLRPQADLPASSDPWQDADYHIAWTLGGEPFLTQEGELVQVVRDAIAAETGLQTQLSTRGGTSDGRFIAKICKEVIELGPSNATLHKINECVPLADVATLKNIYQRVIERLCA